MSLRRRGWVLFDLDGTLLDYAAAEVAALQATLADAGLVADDDVMAAYRVINERHWSAFEKGETTATRLRLERWRDLLAEQGLAGVTAQRLAERYLGHLAAGAQLLEGARDVLAEVARSHRVGLITNGLADVQRPRITASGVGAFAEVVVVSDEVGAAKPHPAIFDAAFASMGGPDRADVTIVGDSLSADIAGGRAYGIRTVWLADADVPHPEADGTQPDHRIASLRELPPLLEELAPVR